MNADLRNLRQRGAALVCALLLMMVTMMIGVAISRTVFASIASAGAERERGLAYEAAEAALRDAERDIDAATDAARAAQFTEAGAAGFVDGCGRAGVGRGLCLASSPPAWQALDLAEDGSTALVPYGYYTGAALATGKGLLPARPPAYLIEKIVPPGATEALGSFYRITAIGFGSRASTRVVLQSVVRKPRPAPPAGSGPPGGTGEEPAAAPPGASGPADSDGAPGFPGPQEPAAPQPPGTGLPPIQLPAGRISWREIANWPQLHAQALE
jgi:type IV pilus assembly protein PilX